MGTRGAGASRDVWPRSAFSLLAVLGVAPEGDVGGWGPPGPQSTRLGGTPWKRADLLGRSHPGTRSSSEHVTYITPHAAVIGRQSPLADRSYCTVTVQPFQNPWGCELAIGGADEVIE